MSHRVSQFHLSLLKSYLKRSTFDLFEAWKAIQLALLSELKSNQAKQQLWMPLELSGALYGIVWGWVSCEALRKVEEQWKLLAKTDPPPSLTWTGIFTWVYGLLCIYILNSFRGSLLPTSTQTGTWYMMGLCNYFLSLASVSSQYRPKAPFY